MKQRIERTVAPMPWLGLVVALGLMTGGCSDVASPTGANEGQFCLDDAECAQGLECNPENVCVLKDAGNGGDNGGDNGDNGPCMNAADCEAGEVCQDGNCVTPRPSDGDDDDDGFQTPGDCDDGDHLINPEARELCDGKDNDCDSDTDEGCPDCVEGQSRLCGRNVGTCSQGSQQCVGGAWSQCTDIAPVPEVCGDDLDNDCDGSIDEGCPCETGDTLDCGADEGACTVGTQNCVGGSWDTCSGAAPQEERCDGVDNNCDGVTDEGYGIGLACESPGACGAGVRRCRPAELFPEEDDTPPDPDNPDAQTPSVPEWICSTDPALEDSPAGEETCDGQDNDCDGLVDEDFMVGTACEGVGACGEGALECDIDGGTQCSSNPGGSASRASEEICDEVDNDCDGSTDEDFFMPGEACQGRGACGIGIKECDGDFAWRCSTNPGGSQYVLVEEICNGIDDDCDGETDEGFSIGEACNPGGECAEGAVECLSAELQAETGQATVCSTAPNGSQYVEIPELCDGIDNDCDGSVDETFDVGQPCDGEGECGAGVTECLNSGETICSTEPGGSNDQSMAELCDDADNDCDGASDEDFLVGQECDGTGECGLGVYECRGPLRSDCTTNPGGSRDGTSNEQCDSRDNDCDGAIDEDFEVGLECDGIGECGIGVWECRTPNERRCSTDADGSASESEVEVCDLLDNDCDAETDESRQSNGSDICPVLSHAGARCNLLEGQCEIEECSENFFDLNTVVSDGCECAGDDDEPNGGDRCNQSIQHGGLSDDSGDRRVISGNLVEAPGRVDEDWHTFTAVDHLPADLANHCDRFYASVRFLENPGDAFRFDIYAGGCDPSEAIFNGCTQFNNSTSYYDGPAAAAFAAQNPNLTVRGECGCRGPDELGRANVTQRSICSDNTETYYVRVYRRQGARVSCAGYVLEISNGVYEGRPPAND